MPNYNIRSIKSRRSYSVNEMASLLSIDRKTCQRWLKNGGLRPIERNVSPILVMGFELIDLIRRKRAKRRVSLEKDEFYCLKCNKATKAKSGSEEIVKTGKRIGKNNQEQYMKIANCERCGTKMNKYLGVFQKD